MTALRKQDDIREVFGDISSKKLFQLYITRNRNLPSRERQHFCFFLRRLIQLNKMDNRFLNSDFR